VVERKDMACRHSYAKEAERLSATAKEPQGAKPSMTLVLYIAIRDNKSACKPFAGYRLAEKSQR